MSNTTLGAMLTSVPRFRTSRLGRQATTATATVAGEYLVEAAGLTVPVEIDAPLIVGEALAACKGGELVVATGSVTKYEWLNRRGCPGEKWSIAAKQVDREALERGRRAQPPPVLLVDAGHVATGALAPTGWDA